MDPSRSATWDGSSRGVYERPPEVERRTERGTKRPFPGDPEREPAKRPKGASPPLSAPLAYDPRVSPTDSIPGLNNSAPVGPHPVPLAEHGRFGEMRDVRLQWYDLAELRARAHVFPIQVVEGSRDGGESGRATFVPPAVGRRTTPTEPRAERLERERQERERERGRERVAELQEERGWPEVERAREEREDSEPVFLGRGRGRDRAREEVDERQLTERERAGLKRAREELGVRLQEQARLSAVRAEREQRILEREREERARVQERTEVLLAEYERRDRERAERERERERARVEEERRLEVFRREERVREAERERVLRRRREEDERLQRERETPDGPNGFPRSGSAALLPSTGTAPMPPRSYTDPSPVNTRPPRPPAAPVRWTPLPPRNDSFSRPAPTLTPPTHPPYPSTAPPGAGFPRVGSTPSRASSIATSSTSAPPPPPPQISQVGVEQRYSREFIPNREYTAAEAARAARERERSQAQDRDREREREDTATSLDRVRAGAASEGWRVASPASTAGSGPGVMDRERERVWIPGPGARMNSLDPQGGRAGSVGSSASVPPPVPVLGPGGVYGRGEGKTGSAVSLAESVLSGAHTGLAPTLKSNSSQAPTGVTPSLAHAADGRHIMRIKAEERQTQLAQSFDLARPALQARPPPAGIRQSPINLPEMPLFKSVVPAQPPPQQPALAPTLGDDASRPPTPFLQAFMEEMLRPPRSTTTPTPGSREPSLSLAPPLPQQSRSTSRSRGASRGRSLGASARSKSSTPMSISTGGSAPPASSVIPQLPVVLPPTPVEPIPGLHTVSAMAGTTQPLSDVIPGLTSLVSSHAFVPVPSSSATFVAPATAAPPSRQEPISNGPRVNSEQLRTPPPAVTNKTARPASASPSLSDSLYGASPLLIQASGSPVTLKAGQDSAPENGTPPITDAEASFFAPLPPGLGFLPPTSPHAAEPGPPETIVGGEAAEEDVVGDASEVHTDVLSDVDAAANVSEGGRDGRESPLTEDESVEVIETGPAVLALPPKSDQLPVTEASHILSVASSPVISQEIPSSPSLSDNAVSPEALSPISDAKPSEQLDAEEIIAESSPSPQPVDDVQNSEAVPQKSESIEVVLVPTSPAAPLVELDDLPPTLAYLKAYTYDKLPPVTPTFEVEDSDSGSFAEDAPPVPTPLSSLPDRYSSVPAHDDPWATVEGAITESTAAEPTVLSLPQPTAHPLSAKSEGDPADPTMSVMDAEVEATPALDDTDSVMSSLTDPPSSTPSLSPIVSSAPARRLEDYANFVKSNRKRKQDLLEQLAATSDPIQRHPIEMRLKEMGMIEDLIPELGSTVAWRPKTWNEPLVRLSVPRTPSTDNVELPPGRPKWAPPVEPPEAHFDEERPFSDLLMPKDLSDLMQPSRKSTSRGVKRKFVLHGVPYKSLDVAREYIETFAHVTTFYPLAHEDVLLVFRKTPPAFERPGDLHIPSVGRIQMTQIEGGW